jgi:hypothetical protein
VAGKSPKEAADNFVNFLKETLSCISSHYLSAYQQSTKLYKVYYDPYAEVSSRDGIDYQVSIAQIFRVIPDPQSPGQFKAKTQEYSYRLLLGPGENTEIFAYHWHPLEPGVSYPHLHIMEAPRIHRIHFPTSRVCLEDFVWLLLRDYQIHPKLPHAECKRILEKNKRAFEKMATWKIQSP